jgi:hypothetical protein
MEDEIQAASLATDPLDESLETFRALCFEHVGICRAIQSPEMRVRALVKTEAAFVDCLAALWKESASGPGSAAKQPPAKAKGCSLRSASPK